MTMIGVTVYIGRSVSKIADDGTWVSTDPRVEKMLNQMAGIDTLKGYYPDRNDAMLRKVLEYFPNCRYEIDESTAYEYDPDVEY